MIVDVLSPVAGSAYEAAADELMAAYIPAFTAAGMKIRPRPWDRGPGDGDATLALFAWGYHFDVGRWWDMLAAWPEDRLLFNPPRLLAWNTRKTYLKELAAAGIPILPSIFGHADHGSVAAAIDHFGASEIIVKPQVSGGSYRTVRLRSGDAVEPLEDAILQPFMPAILSEGELSFLFIGGRFSHAVRKVAKPGDFRIQPQFGGKFSRFEPAPAALALAGRVIAAVSPSPLYARIDLLRLPDGTLALMELEAIEPDLYVDLAPQVPALLAAALRDRCSGYTSAINSAPNPA